MTNAQRRDYSITGPENKRAQERGLASAQWYESPIPRATMKGLMRRTNGPAIRDTLIWFVALAASGYLAYLSWGTWWAIPAFFVYGSLYAAPGDSRWHECGHGTAFKTPWMNEAIYQLASFMVLRSATPWRWSHTRHHTDTYIVGRDPEILTPRPPLWKLLLMQIVNLYGGPIELKRFILHTFGKIEAQEKEYIPQSENWKVFLEARIYMLIILGTLSACLYTGSLLPAMFVFLPSFYGFFFVLFFAFSQHAGLYEDVLDHRLNTRTIYYNRVLRFLYWNMNYHVEHHMFPMVPYHALPKLHEAMKADCPEARPSLWAATKEVLAALRKQKDDPAYVIVKPLPATARPYMYGIGHAPAILSASDNVEANDRKEA